MDSSKRFLDLYVGVHGSMNDSCVLRRSTLYSTGQQRSMWPRIASFNGFIPYLLGDGGYPLLPWLLVPHRQRRQLSAVERLFNRKLSTRRFVVENTFALLKSSFRELQQRSELNVVFLLDVVTYCAILHNVLRR